MTTPHADSEPTTDAYRPKISHVIVVKKEDEKLYRLRVYLECDGPGEVICFETGPEFTKAEADWRAVLLTNRNGLRHEELPTRSYQMPYPQQDSSP